MIEAGLRKRLSTFTAAPFLFVGSGLGQRYLGTENWEDLLKKFAAPLPEQFGYYKSKSNDDLAQLGSIIAKEFHDVWWKADVYKPSRDEFADVASHLSSPLKFEISKYLRGLTPKNSFAENAELEMLKKATLGGIITTNWDPLMEHLFPDYKVYRSQEELLFSHPQSIAEIYKIHGCCSHPDSLVLTKEDYDNFNTRNSYLAAKLLTIFVEHPVLFCGYSLSDPDITALLKDITRCLNSDNIRRLENHLIFVQRANGATDKLESSYILLDGNTIPITRIQTDDFLQVFSALNNPRKIPAKILRQLKNQVYELVKTNDPKSQLLVTDLASETDGSEIQFVYGVGVAAQHIAQIGYETVGLEQLCEDVVFNNKSLQAERVINSALTGYLKKSEYTPVFKYLREAGYFDGKKAEIDDLPQYVCRAAKATASSFANQSQQYLKKKPAIQALSGMKELLLTETNLRHRLIYIPYLKNLDAEELGAYLQKNFKELMSLEANHKPVFSHVRKLICLYDFLKYGPQARSAMQVRAAARGQKNLGKSRSHQ